MAPSQLVQERTCNAELNWSTTTLRDLDWKCTSDCVVFHPPQFFQRPERTSTASSTIQCAFRCTHHTHSGQIATEEPPQDQQAPSPTTVTSLAFLTSFPIGCQVAEAPSHPKHAITNGTVTWHPPPPPLLFCPVFFLRSRQDLKCQVWKKSVTAMGLGGNKKLAISELLA